MLWIWYLFVVEGGWERDCRCDRAEKREEWISGWVGSGVGFGFGFSGRSSDVDVVVSVSMAAVELSKPPCDAKRAFKPSTSRVITTFKRPFSGRRVSGILSHVFRPIMTALMRGTGSRVPLLLLWLGTRFVTRAK